MKKYIKFVIFLSFIYFMILEITVKNKSVFENIKTVLIGSVILFIYIYIGKKIKLLK